MSIRGLEEVSASTGSAQCYSVVSLTEDPAMVGWRERRTHLAETTNQY